MDFATIDFETANYYRDSACQLGITYVESGAIVKSEGFIINPETFFDNFNSRLHGISEETVKDKPIFNDVWDYLLPQLDGKILISHNAIFDFGVLRSTLSNRNLKFPNSKTYCTYQMAKKVHPGLPSYSLDFLCSKFGIDLHHHDAISDSQACASLFLKLCNDAEINSFDDFFDKLLIFHGSISQNDFSNPRKKRTYINNTDISVSPNSILNTESPFFEKTVVFTGTLSSMERKVAFQKIVDLGGYIANSVGKKTDFLVVGQIDYKQVGEKGASTKQLQAETLNSKGQEIEIVSEKFFLENI
ncbi:exonuclease domain-containing protein [Sphingobacterium siyangense]|uniref:exonuclease domain-containing protein n=1 Tax=Sphingobacterium siyangense TaxID=459529 RepID=UPI003DA64AAB